MLNQLNQKPLAQSTPTQLLMEDVEMKAYQPTQVVVVTKATCQEKKVIFAMLNIPLATVLIGLLPTGEKFTVSQLVGVTLIVMPQVPTQLVYILPVILGYTKLILMVPL